MHHCQPKVDFPVARRMYGVPQQKGKEMKDIPVAEVRFTNLKKRHCDTCDCLCAHEMGTITLDIVGKLAVSRCVRCGKVRTYEPEKKAAEKAR